MTPVTRTPRRGLCLFDLDETLIPLDSDHAWGEFMIRLGWVDEASFRARNDAFFADYQRGALDIHAYVAFTTAPIRERPQAERDAAQARFMDEVIRPAMRPEALDLVRRHRDAGDLCAIVTATNDFVTAPIAQAFGVPNLIAVRLERGAGGTITGRIDGVPSYREGKVVRCTEWLASLGHDWNAFERVSVYSDSANDLPLLERATDPVAANPSASLERVAVDRGWRILRLFA
jgi:HAD superfamily hydrolase (TIGR01490 family)